MITASQWTPHLLAHSQRISASLNRELLTETRDRLMARWADGRADKPLDFSDLASRLEDALSPRMA